MSDTTLLPACSEPGPASKGDQAARFSHPMPVRQLPEPKRYRLRTREGHDLARHLAQRLPDFLDNRLTVI